MRFLIALWFGKLINLLISFVDKTRGTNLSGEKALKVDPKMVSKFKGIDVNKVLIVTGTNGKSTSANLITHIFKSNNKNIIANLQGANLISGVASLFIKNSSLLGKIKAEYVVLEVDERFVPKVLEQIPARNLLITNLQKDQVQRNGDPDIICRILKPAITEDMKLFLNNEEPRTKSFEKLSKNIVTYGVHKHDEAFIKDETFPTMSCPLCYHKIEFKYFNNDGMGAFSCNNCGFQNNKEAKYSIYDVNFNEYSFKYDETDFIMPYNSPYMCYNYAAAIAVAKEIANILPEDASKSFKSFKNVSGRFEILEYKEKTIKYMRIKQENPETLQTCINVMSSDPSKKMVCLGLCPLIDMIPHYLNSFYAYDCDFKKLANQDVERYFCFSDGVCYDTAKRLILEGVSPEKITVVNSEDVKTLFGEIDKVETNNIYLITWLKTFKHMKKYYDKEILNG
ncbi:MAG TPA: MurT ligase domain-containing protein [Anaerovoracaceae bacterium]|nr:MurT ligase domain-containing protein [Anaerovoracaceae bacterium]